MILSLFVSSIETTLMTIETNNAIAMRLGMISNGETEPLRETELTVRKSWMLLFGPDPTNWQMFLTR
jgi:hypothetical protein